MAGDQQRRAAGLDAILALALGLCSCADDSRLAAGGEVFGAGGEAGAAGGSEPPLLLSETGLYAGDELAPGVVAYRPRFELWADGAEKQRFLWLPPGARIDSSNMDAWVYPVGTRVWKEFSRDGQRIETRLLEKRHTDDWWMVAYQWNDEQSDAMAVPRGARNASGTQHDIPSAVDCGICHDNVPDRLLGVTALQLAHSEPGLTLDGLVAEARLSDPPSSPLELPGSAITQAALGYLHANCGSCHNPSSEVYPTVKLELWLVAAELGSESETASYRTTVGVPFEGVAPSSDAPELLVSAGSPEDSALHFRMSVREPNVEMPPLASELVDQQGLATIAAWIESL